MAVFLLFVSVPSSSSSSSSSSSWNSLHCLTCSGIELLHVGHCRCQHGIGTACSTLPNSAHVTMLDRIKAPLASVCTRRNADEGYCALLRMLHDCTRLASSSQAMPYRAQSVRLALRSSFTEEGIVGPQCTVQCRDGQRWFPCENLAWRPSAQIPTPGCNFNTWLSKGSKQQ